MKITFLRHAETTANRDGIFAGHLDCDITEKGFEEASHLKFEEDFSFIYCSPLKRTSQTLYAFSPNTIPIIDKRIIEVDVGIWQGQSKTSLTKPLIQQFVAGNYLPKGAEKIEDTDKRVADFIIDLFNKHSENDNILVVTHNGTIRSVKRLFPEKSKSVMSKNLETFTIDSDDFKKYKPIC